MKMKIKWSLSNTKLFLMISLRARFNKFIIYPSKSTFINSSSSQGRGQEVSMIPINQQRLSLITPGGLKLRNASMRVS